MASEPLFLSEEEVLEIHAEQLSAHGGAAGILDQGGLSSAVVHPQTVYCYQDGWTIFDLAAAYAFHIAKNHPFRDGNKRTGAACAIVFLRVNGWNVTEEFPDQMLAVAAGEMSKDELASELKRISKKSITKMLGDMLGD